MAGGSVGRRAAAPRGNKGGLEALPGLDGPGGPKGGCAAGAEGADQTPPRVGCQVLKHPVKFNSCL